ncbi:hypothetical protein A0H81_01909 [Grifola frondosa]|uniref:Uncharacterized protein n=1 Tax=Grifola frondosa TaxID=5627 RepID=A0A1C7MP75_GRIFR|nr:hypothetical protein A0H81_01909 [Grifola frondosa]
MLLETDVVPSQMAVPSATGEWLIENEAEAVFRTSCKLRRSTTASMTADSAVLSIDAGCKWNCYVAISPLHFYEQRQEIHSRGMRDMSAQDVKTLMYSRRLSGGIAGARRSSQHIKSGSSVTFGRIDDIAAPTPCSPAVVPPIQSESIKQFGSVQASPSSIPNGRVPSTSTSTSSPST